MSTFESSPNIAVVIPCYRVSQHLLNVVTAIPDCVTSIYCVNDGCPDNSTQVIKQHMAIDNRLKVVMRATNGGVGAAVISGYLEALKDEADIVIKIDGDGQMDPAIIPLFVAEIQEGRADYVKGNRFFSIKNVKSMPLSRKIGNMGLSFFTKLSTGYWQLFDPTNGFTAIHANILKALPLTDIEHRYFFESDMLFQLGLLRARIVEVPMQAVYGEEESHLSEIDALCHFPIKHGRNFFKRMFYDYFLRNFNIASVELIFGLLFVSFGVVFGVSAWIDTAQTNQSATAGTVMLASLPTIVGIQFLLNFIGYDMAREPDQVVHNRLELYQADKKGTDARKSNKVTDH